MKNRVLVGLSGGVDSAVAALLLKEKGFEVVGAFMKNFSENKNKLTGECNWIEDKKEAEKIAILLDIQLLTLNFEKEYKKLVINPMFKSYKEGLTPNPDAFCNKFIKFPLLWREAKKIGANYIATGHYIKKIKEKDGFSLKIPKDESKDQSYFLYELNQKDLEHTLFPIGDYTKQEVRQIAKKNKFPNYERKGSKGICFVGKTEMKLFLRKKIKKKIGKIISSEGENIGEHPGHMYFTIGEKLGEKKEILFNDKAKIFAGKKIYVYKKDKKNNILYVATEGNKNLQKKEFFIKKINWMLKKPNSTLNCKVRIRHLGKLVNCTIKMEKNIIHCLTRENLFGVADGQSAVFYKNKKIICGGEIFF